MGSARGFGDRAVHSIRRLLVRARASVCAPANLWLVLVAAPRCGRRIRRLPRRRHRVGRDRFALYIPHRWQTAMSDMSRSEEHTSELQSLMRISYAVFCLKKKTHTYIHNLYM